MNALPASSEFMVKVLRAGKTRWAFLSHGGHTNHLRIHALRYREEDEAKKMAADIEADNPGTKAKVVRA